MTLVELVIIMTLLGLVAFSVVPKFNAYDAIHTRAAAKQLAADLRYAQSRAISTRVRHGVDFDVAGETYTVFRESPGTPAADPLDPGTEMTRTLKRVGLAAVSFGTSDAVWFDSMGTPYDESGDELLAVGLVILSDGINVDTVSVRPITGAIEQ